jgi:hypothetical protein
MQDDVLSSGGDSDHTDGERGVASLDSRKHYNIVLPCFFTMLSELMLLGDASVADRLVMLKSEGAPDSAISIGRSSVITVTTAGVTQFSEVS